MGTCKECNHYEWDKDIGKPVCNRFYERKYDDNGGFIQYNPTPEKEDSCTFGFESLDSKMDAEQKELFKELFSKIEDDKSWVWIALLLMPLLSHGSGDASYWHGKYDAMKEVYDKFNNADEVNNG